MDDELLRKLIRRLQQRRDKRQAYLSQSPDRADLDKLIAEYEAGIERTELAHNLRAFIPHWGGESDCPAEKHQEKTRTQAARPWLKA